MPNLPILYEPESPNLAPVKPLLELQRGALDGNTTFQNAIRAKFKHHISLEDKTRRELYLSGYEVANYIEGRQFMRPNPWAPGTYLSYTPKQASEQNKRSLNLMRFYTTNSMWKWQLSNPDVVAVAGVSTEQAREAARAADLIIEHYERKFFDPLITLREALHGLCWGTYIWRIRYDGSLNAFTALQDIYGEQEVQIGEGHGQCGDCGFEGTSQDFALNADGSYTCPQCGGEAMVQQATGTVPSVIGQQQISLGDITAELLPFPECWWDINHRAEESSWFIHQRRTSMVAIRRLLGNIRIPPDEFNDIGLKIVDRLSWAGQSGGGQARADNKDVQLYKEPVTIVEYSLGPDDIADIVLSQPEQTLSGQTIPAGPLLDTFPDGLTVQGLNGLRVITGVYPEHHSKSIVQGIWHSRVTSGLGQGNTDLTEVQKRFNADDSQVHTFLRAVGSPSMLILQEALGDQDRSDYLGMPGMNITVNGRNLPEGTRLGDVVAPAWQPQSVPGQLFNYTYERLNDFAQLTSHITDFSGGLPNVNNRTATGAQISQANSNALFTPPLQVKGEVRKRIAGIVLELYRQHFPVSRPFPLKGKFGRYQYRYLSASDLDTQIELQVTKDSELPKNSFTKREDLMLFFQTLGGGAGYEALSNVNPELVSEIENAFGIDLHTDTFDHIASICQQRIQQMADLVPLIQQLPVQAAAMGAGAQPAPPMGGVPSPQQAPQPTGGGMDAQQQQGAPMDPMAMQAAGSMLLLQAIQPPVALEEPDHDLKAKHLSAWLDWDDGQDAPLELRQAVILLIHEHVQFAMIQGQVEGALMAASMPPQPEQPGGDSGGGSNPPPKSKDKKDSGQPNTTPTDPSKRGPITGRPSAT